MTGRELSRGIRGRLGTRGEKKKEIGVLGGSSVLFGVLDQARGLDLTHRNSTEITGYTEFLLENRVFRELRVFRV
jgi:hypothetical protein